MLDDTNEPIGPNTGSAEVVLKLNATAMIDVESGNGHPILIITDGAVTVLLMPYGPAEGGAIDRCDVVTGSDLVLAASRYRNALAEAYAEQEGEDLPQRRPSRRLLDKREAEAVVRA
jgi:hypothetical protein